VLALAREMFIIRRESVLADQESVTASGLLEEYTELTKGYVVSIHVSVIHYIHLSVSLQRTGFIYVIAWLGVRFGINHTSNVVGMTVKLHEAKRSAICHSNHIMSVIYPKSHS